MKITVFIGIVTPNGLRNFVDQLISQKITKTFRAIKQINKNQSFQQLRATPPHPKCWKLWLVCVFIGLLLFDSLSKTTHFQANHQFYLPELYIFNGIISFIKQNHTCSMKSMDLLYENTFSRESSDLLNKTITFPRNCCTSQQNNTFSKKSIDLLYKTIHFQ